MLTGKGVIKEYFEDKPVRKIQVFGSFARDEQKPDSDIYILLYIEKRLKKTWKPFMKNKKRIA